MGLKASEIYKSQKIDAQTDKNIGMEGKMAENKTNKLIKVTDIYEEAARRYEELGNIKKEREQALAGAPEGKIHIIKAGKRIQFYLREDKADKSGRYISKTETEKIRKYVQKAYDEKVVKELEIELHNLEIFVNNSSKILSNSGKNISSSGKDSSSSGKDSSNSSKIINSIRNIYSDYPVEIKNMINPIDISDEDYIKEWQEVEYIGKAVAEYVPLYETNRKERVRSKSELAIANMLDRYGLPYKYECPVILNNGKTVYPDFTVLNVKERKEMYWEHRGMMDDRDYARQAVFKAKQFRKSGMILGDNLIITEETSTDPLGTDEIESVIKKFLL